METDSKMRVRIGPSISRKPLILETETTEVKGVPPIDRVFTYEGRKIVLDVPQLSHVNVVVQAARQEAARSSG